MVAQSCTNESVTIVLPLPPHALSPNARVHWAARARATKAYRRAARLTAIESGAAGSAWQRAEIQAVFYWPDARRRDTRNAEAALKPAYDGLVDARLFPDDDAKTLVHKRTLFFVDKQYPRVELKVTKR